MATQSGREARLEHRLILLAWLHHLLGYDSAQALLADCKHVAEGVASDGRSHLFHHFLARGDQVRIPPDDLARYDEHIRSHLAQINRHRPQPITLRYFQYLAALYTEIVLDGLFRRGEAWLAALNAFVHAHFPHLLSEPFTPENLTRLAYWMATGSGKTLILHLNYHQFLHYHQEPLDNILLITPNEGLSDQHLQELALSGIPARRFDLHRATLWRAPHEIQVLEITKLVEEKRGGGVRVPVDAFEGRNLIFVDEGHKGAGGEAWRSYREALGETGFTFEYSATFGQALAAAGDDRLIQDYGRAILFDYSYRYFYGDGFGKNFRILNLQEGHRPDHTNILLLGNLLSFYQQLRLYETHPSELRPYNLEKPLWVFVGHTIKDRKSRAAFSSDDRRVSSDAFTVVLFLHKALRDRAWAIGMIDRLLKGESGLLGPDGEDAFRDRFPFLKTLGVDARALYDDILARVFHAPAGGGLHLADIRGGKGEIGLRAPGADAYFGLIYIGNPAVFRSLVEEHAPDIRLEEDVVGDSLFRGVNRPDSPIHVLIGAKKFMEGWNSWRVSNMGLMNIGRSEGSQIIQLFGRGVRLKGKNLSLKRSSALPGPHPDYIDLLETLDIFAVRAAYMAQFRAYLAREGMKPPAEGPRPATPGLTPSSPRPSGPDAFMQEAFLILEADPGIHVRVDRSVRVQTMASGERGLREAQTRAGEERQIPPESLTLVDWDQAYLDLLAYKARQGWSNLLLLPDAPQRLMASIRYTLIADEAVIRPATFAERALLQEAVTSILRAYMAAFYRQRRARWQRDGGQEASKLVEQKAGKPGKPG